MFLPVDTITDSKFFTIGQTGFFNVATGTPDNPYTVIGYYFFNANDGMGVYCGNNAIYRQPDTSNPPSELPYIPANYKCESEIKVLKNETGQGISVVHYLPYDLQANPVSDIISLNNSSFITALLMIIASVAVLDFLRRFFIIKK